MKLALLALALVCLGFASADAASVDGGDSDCSSEIQPLEQTLGGKVIKQELEQIRVPRMGCVWVLRGGTPERFVLAKNCANCRTAYGGVMCSGPGLAMSLKCRLERGPDCRLYSVDNSDPTLPC